MSAEPPIRSLYKISLVDFVSCYTTIILTLFLLSEQDIYFPYNLNINRSSTSRRYTFSEVERFYGNPRQVPGADTTWVMSRRAGPGRGRPPKNSVWNYELGKYVTSSGSHHPSPLQWGPVTDNNESQNASTKDDGGSSLPPPPPMFSWDSDDFEDAVLDVGRRQGPYRNCTRGQRDVSGQYEDGYYAQVLIFPKI